MKKPLRILVSVVIGGVTLAALGGMDVPYGFTSVEIGMTMALFVFLAVGMAAFAYWGLGE